MPDLATSKRVKSDIQIMCKARVQAPTNLVINGWIRQKTTSMRFLHSTGVMLA